MIVRMNHLKRSAGQSHSYFDESVKVTEFNFQDNDFINDAEINIQGRYPLEGYAVNDISTALISVESGAGDIAIKGTEPRELAEGDRVIIKPGEPYAFTAIGTLAIRYIAVPAWLPSQSRIIKD